MNSILAIGGLGLAAYLYIQYLRGKNASLTGKLKNQEAEKQSAVNNEKIAQLDKDIESLKNKEKTLNKESEGKSAEDFWKGKL